MSCLQTRAERLCKVLNVHCNQEKGTPSRSLCDQWLPSLYDEEIFMQVQGIRSNGTGQK